MLASGLKIFFFLTFWGNHTILLHNVDFAPVASFIIRLASSAHLRMAYPREHRISALSSLCYRWQVSYQNCTRSWLK
jgi:hypothetical protein